MSSIKNRKDIYFTSGDSKRSFKAYADTPLVIINKKLGYKISFELSEFFFDEASGRTFYYGYTRFEDMGTKSRWIKNRKQCYYGSTMHFYRSLIENDLKKQGYQIYLIKPVHLSTDSSGSKKQQVTNRPSGTQGEMEMAVGVTAAQIIRQRRSAVAFDGKTSLTKSHFAAILDKTLPRMHGAPFDFGLGPPRVHLLLFVHRVTGLAPGLYLFLRDDKEIVCLDVRQK